MTTTQHLDTEDTLALKEATRRLVDEFHPEMIYLFGSRARGDWNEDSDFDVMVIVPSSDVPRYRRAQLAYRALRGLSLPVEVHVWTREEFERYLTVVASLAATVTREGNLLYAT